MPDPNSQARANVVKQILYLGLAGAGAGVAGRSALGLRHLFQQPREIPFISPGPSTMDFPLATPPEKQKRVAGAGNIAKLAAELDKLAAEPGLMDRASTMIGDAIPEVTSRLPDLGITHWLSQHVSDQNKSPWAAPLTMGAVGLGVGGGWKLTDSLLKQRQQADLDSDLEKAKKEYQDALLSQQTAGQKLAADSPHAKLDDLCDTYLEKAALFGSGVDTAVADTAGRPLGLLLSAMGVVGAGSAYGTYNWTKDRSRASLLDKAMKERSRQLWNRNPQQVVVLPKEVPMPAQAA